MAVSRLEDIEVGEAMPVGIRGTAADLLEIAGATVSGTFSLNGGTAVSPVAGVLFDAPDTDGFIGVVPFPGSLVTAKGSIEGAITVTKADEVWSPRIVRFSAKVYSHA